MRDGSDLAGRKLLLSLPPRTDRGDATVSHLGLIVLIALVSGALVATGLPAQISDRVNSAACQVTGQGDCEPARTSTSNGDGATGPAEPGTIQDPTASGAPAAPTAADRPGLAAPNGKDGDDGGYWSCGWFGITACDMVQGFGKGTKQVFIDTVESTCLIHFCSTSGFLNTWKGTIDGVKGLYDDPPGTAISMWNESTKEIREDWKAGHKASAITRAVPRALSALFGLEAASKLRKLRKDRKAAKAATPVAQATKAAEKAVKSAEKAAAKGNIKAVEAALKEVEKQARNTRAAARASGNRDDLVAAVATQERLRHTRRILTRARVARALASTEAGRHAQTILTAFNIKVIYRNEPGGKYDGNKTVYISELESEIEQVRATIHEAHHAEKTQIGQSALHEATDMEREEYVGAMADEETEATALEYEDSRERRARSDDIPLGDLEVIYNQAYDRAVRAALSEDANLSEAARATIGKRAGTRALRDEYLSGRVEARPGESYVDYYGAVWDDANGIGS